MHVGFYPANDMSVISPIASELIEAPRVVQCCAEQATGRRYRCRKVGVKCSSRFIPHARSRTLWAGTAARIASSRRLRASAASPPVVS